MNSSRQVSVSAVLVVLACALASEHGVLGQQPAPAGRGAATTPQPGGRGARGAPPAAGAPRAPLGTGPWIFEAAERQKIKVSIVTGGLQNPWSLQFLPDGSMLVTERPGRLRIIRNGVLDPTPVAGVPAVRVGGLSGLMDIALHPKFAENKLVYLTYTKKDEKNWAATTLARGRLEGGALVDVKDLFLAEPWWDAAGGGASRIVFGRDGMLYMTTGSAGGAGAGDGQKTNIHKGKVLRLRDDGTFPPDNPFVGKPGFKPEIYTWGHRNQLGLIVHPVTGEVWNSEQGPNGGDEINIIRAGRNYGWPIVSLGRSYEGPWQGAFEKDGMEGPLVYWMPSIAASGLMVYTGDRFPAWRNNAFVGALRFGELANTGHLQRIVFNEQYEEMRREMLLTGLQQRIRDVKQGPDGLLYLLTDENPGALLKIEPAP